MKISAVEEYGLRCLLAVASEAGTEERVSAEAIAEREGLSLPYAQKLLRRLSEAGMVESRRGPNGGYQLARPADALSVGDAMRELGGTLEIEEFCESHTGNRDICAHDCNCGIRPVWAHISNFLIRTMEQIPLSVLLDDEDAVQSFLEDLEGTSGTASERERTEPELEAR